MMGTNTIERNGTASVADVVVPELPRASSLARALLSSAPRVLLDLEAELLMFKGQYLLHYREAGGERCKLLSPGALRQAFADQPLDSGWLAPNVMRVGECAAGLYAVLWVPPGRHKLQVAASAPVEDEEQPQEGEGTRRRRRRGANQGGRGNHAKATRTVIEEIEVPLPGMVFAGVGHEYRLWAVREESFSPKGRVYHPPLPNVHDGGLVCWGDNHPPSAAGQAVVEAWRMFLGSPFNDHLAGSRSRAFPNDVRALLWRLAREAEPTFPVDDLGQYAVATVEQEINRMIGVQL